MACKCTVAARKIFPKCAGDLERDLQCLGPLVSPLHAHRGWGCQCHTAVMAESCLSWTGQGRTSRMTGEPHAPCARCIQPELCRQVPTVLQWVNWISIPMTECPQQAHGAGCFVGLRTFQGSSCRVILSSSRLYLELRLPADQSTVPKSCTVILVLLGDFGESCFSLFCLGLHGVTNHFLRSLSASIVPAQGSDGRCCDPSSSLLQGTHLGGLTPAIAITVLKCLLGDVAISPFTLY